LLNVLNIFGINIETEYFRMAKSSG